MPDPDRLFDERLKRGWDAQKRLAERWRSKGFDCTLPPLRKRPRYEDRWKYQDGGDLFLEGLVIEVKARGMSFCGISERFPYPTATLSYLRVWKRIDPKPAAIVIMSEGDPDGILIATLGTFPRWRIETIRDPWKKSSEEIYTIPRELLLSEDDFLELLPILR